MKIRLPKIYMVLLIYLSIFALILVSCHDKYSYYEYFYDIELDQKAPNRKFAFNVRPMTDKPYRVMLVFYPKNDQEREEVFKYSRISNSLSKTYTVVLIKKNNGETIYKNESYIRLTSHNSKELDCYLIYDSIQLEKNKDYIVEVEFRNLHEYPLSHIESKLAFGVGRYYETSSFY